MKKRNLIVFDIDGTLTDTVEIHQKAFKKSLQLIGVEKFNDSFGTYKHHTDSYIAKVIYEFSTKKSFDKSVNLQFENHLYELICQSEISEISGSKHIINYIENETDFGICYATGSLYRPANLKLEKIGIDFHPMQLVASDEIEEREKIVEKAIENAKKHYKIEKFDKIISFGDGLWDLKTAKNLSLEFIGIGKTNEEILRKNGMKKHFYNFNKMTITDL
jgi:beta-phosphoglucomutase-like phosphatase (HAD superfamily)